MRAVILAFIILLTSGCASSKQEDARRPVLTSLRGFKIIAEQNMQVAVVTGRQLDEPRRTAYLEGAEIRYVRAQSLANGIIEDVALTLETGTIPTPIDQLQSRCTEMEFRFREFIEFLESQEVKPISYSDDLKVITGTFSLVTELIRGSRSVAEKISIAKQVRLLLWRKWPNNANPGRGMKARADPFA